MTLLTKTAWQFAVILVLTDLLVITADRFDLALGWRIADIALIALGVFLLRIYQEVAFAAFRADGSTDLG